MIKVISGARRNPALSDEEFQRKMREEHLPLVARFPGLVEYVVHFAVGKAPWDSVVELVFPSEQAFHAALASPEGQAAFAHMRELIDLGTVQSGVFEVVGGLGGAPR